MLAEAASRLAGAVVLDPVDVAIASGLVLVAGGISVALRLQLEKRLAIASVRTVAQLIAIGYVLKWVFSIDSAPVLAAVLGVMISAAAHAAIGRSDRKYKGVYRHALVSLTVTALVTTFSVTGAVIGVERWWEPQYVIPLLGMVLGNGLTGISLALDTLLEAFSDKRPVIEARLALGATRWEAAREPLRDAVRRGMIPIINSMTVVGLVSLPGMMTGQILAGADPLQAVLYQIVVMFMIAAATAMGAIGVALLAWRRLFDDHHRLRADLIEDRD